MRDPFKIDGPTAISFSGGRTSGYMLWRVLQSNNGLPAGSVVCFANTGKEDEATLRFVRDCGDYWNVPIVWLEYRNDGFGVVDFETASRNGEPFEAIILKRNYLPNPVTRFCTVELKIRVMAKFLKVNGFLDDELDMMIGIRADEQRRVSKMRNGKHSESRKINNCVPLADAGVTAKDVAEFWEQQPFTLELPTYQGRTLAGNCDLCFQLRSVFPEAGWPSCQFDCGEAETRRLVGKDGIHFAGIQTERRTFPQRPAKLCGNGYLRRKADRPVRSQRRSDCLLLRRLTA